MKAADTSLVVAAFASWHERHDAARRAVDGGLRLIEHCAIETYSVLTRLPPPHRTSGEVVRDFLTARFPQPFLRLSAQAYKDFILGLPGRSVASVAELVTCDRRALPVYERYGLRTQLLA